MTCWRVIDHVCISLTEARNWSRGYYPYDVDYRARFRRNTERDKNLYWTGEHWKRDTWHSRPVSYRPCSEYATSVHTDPGVRKEVKKEADMKGRDCGEFSGRNRHMQGTVAATNSEVHQRVSRRDSTDHPVAYEAYGDKVTGDCKK